MLRPLTKIHFREDQSHVLPISKSWLNRALIIASFVDRPLQENALLRDEISSEGDDTRHLRKALCDLRSGKTEFFIGESGTGFRFLLARLSRQRGRFLVRGSERLFSRPHATLLRALVRLGCKVTIGATGAEVIAAGWPDVDVEIEVDSTESSQFASALMLASVGFPNRLLLRTTGEEVSGGYRKMTHQMLDAVAGDPSKILSLRPEIDFSTAFTIAATALASGGSFEFSIVESAQPDRRFVDLLKAMGASVEIRDERVVLRAPEGRGRWRAIDVDLGGAPDLFPCLAALAAVADGRSVLRGALHLRAKESDRIAGIERLLQTVGVVCIARPDGIEIEGLAGKTPTVWSERRDMGWGFEFDPERDHRLAFAAGVLAAAGVPIDITARGVVAKSFPQYWSLLEGRTPRFAIVGQRGVGKSTFAKANFDATHFDVFDLDREIENRVGSSVVDFFSANGESYFRDVEMQTWKEIEAKTREWPVPSVAVVGAGFDVAQIDPSWRAIWVRRQTDRDGRIFLDRPRLEPGMEVLAEYRHRGCIRESRYAARANVILDLPEGGDPVFEKLWISDLTDAGAIAGIGGVVTLLEGRGLAERCERLLRWGVRRLEWRNDRLATPLQLSFLKTLPPEKILLSFRGPTLTGQTLAVMPTLLAAGKTAAGQLAVDWDCGLGPLPPAILEAARSHAVELIISQHDRSANEQTVAELIDRESALAAAVGHSNFIVKAALATSSFRELECGHRWAQMANETRVFLPMSNGVHPRWQWYRSLKLHPWLAFWREGDGSALDQPTLAQWWRARRADGFAAVLGHPVHHSRSPSEHAEFFARLAMPMFAIDIARAEYDDAFRLLTELGLRAAAVTSPLKEVAAQAMGAEIPATNTLWREPSNQWLACSTDAIGFLVLWNEAGLPSVESTGDNVIIWGGGGVLHAIREVLPHARSLRSSIEPDALEKPPEIVVWAAGEGRGAWPPKWQPKHIVDLSYAEASAGRAVALETGARYTSGLAMFKAQAKAQQGFWSQHGGQ